MAGSLGLPVLVSRVLGGITNQLEQGEDVSLAVWSNVLRGIRDGCSERELADATRISKRLAVAAATAAVRRGLITATKAKGGRALALTDSGRDANHTWSKRLASFDEPAKLRKPLEALVSQFTLELPWFPASYGTADPSAIGGSFVPAKPGDDLPGHGQDWRPVRRGEGDTVSSVPLTALLSEVLMQFSIDYEARPMWPLSSTTLVVQHLPTKRTPLADFAHLDHGITGEGKSLLERHGVAKADRKRGLVQLTPLGAQIREHHAEFVANIEAQWRDRYGAATIKALRKALEAHPSAKDKSLPDHVVAP